MLSAVRNESAAASASALPAFYMYEHPALDHSWLHSCDRFEPLRLSVNDSNTAEVGVAQVRSEERRFTRVHSRSDGRMACRALAGAPPASIAYARSLICLVVLRASVRVHLLLDR